MIIHRIIAGDALACLRNLSDCSVQCCITSPPYFGLRDYGIVGQIGLEDTPEEYVTKIVEVFREVRRVLRDDGTLWLNIGDSYAGSGKGPTGSNGIGDQGKRQGFTDPGVSIPAGMKPKDMMGIPWTLALALRDDGWYLRSEIIWAKPAPMPESVTDRPTKSHEQIFLLSKKAQYYYDAEAIREKTGNEMSPEEYAKRTAPGATWKTGDITKHAGDNKHDGGYSHPNGRNSRTVWTINTQVRADGHYASFPDEIPRRCISAGTSEYGCCPACGAPYKRIVEASGGTIGQGWHQHDNDGVTGQIGGMPTKGYKREFKGWEPGCMCTAGSPVPCVVLDPFMGSGTVAVVARDINRSVIGIELSPEYVQIIRKRLHVDQQLDTGTITYRFEGVHS